MFIRSTKYSSEISSKVKELVLGRVGTNIIHEHAQESEKVLILKKKKKRTYLIASLHIRLISSFTEPKPRPA